MLSTTEAQRLKYASRTQVCLAADAVDRINSRRREATNSGSKEIHAYPRFIKDLSGLN